MKSDFLSLVQTDLIQAKIIKQTEKLSYLNFLFLFLRLRTCRVQTFIRLRSSNKLMSFVSKVYLDTFFIEVGKNTKIGKYFWMPHPRCIIIADDVVIGEHVHVGQYVTIGGSFKKIKILENGKIQKLPIIGNRIMIHPGAVIGGPVTVKDDVIIGANAVVTKDIPSNTMCFGQNQQAKKKIAIPPEGGRFEILGE